MPNLNKSEIPLKVLFLEDALQDAEICSELIKISGYNLIMDITSTEKEYESFLRTRMYDIILADFNLPGFDAFHALKLSSIICPNIPFICVSGFIGEETAIELLKLGATDYVRKDRPDRLPFAIKRALDNAKEKETRRNAELMLSESERKYHNIFDNLIDVYFETTLEGVIVEISPSIEILSKGNYRRGDLLGKSVLDFLLFSIDGQVFLDLLKKDGSVTDYEFIFKNQDNTNIPCSVSSKLHYNTHNNSVKIVGTVRDISDRKYFEEEISRMANILEATPDLVGMADLKGNIFYINHGGRLLMNIPDSEVIAKLKISDFHPEDVSKKIMNEGLPTAAKDGYWSSETKLLSRDGEEIPVLQVIISHKNSMNIITHYSTIIRDIREIKLSDKKLQKLSLAIEQSPISVVITNKNGDIEFANKKFCEITGYEIEEIIGKNPRIIKSGHHSEKLYEELWAAILTGKEWKGEILNKKKNGTLYWESEIISPLINNEGDITHFVAIKEDITEKKEMISELIKSKEKAESANKLKDAFIANMSHEIRTPLNGIIGMANLIKEIFHQDIKEEDEELFEGIDFSSKRIIRTVDMMLNYSRLQVGEFPVNRKNILLSPICSKLVMEFTAAAKSKSLDISFQQNCGDMTILGDEYSITLAVSNLIDNAIKYTNKGFIDLVIHLGNNDDLILDIVDTGIGISDSFLGSAFEPYRQEQMGYGRSYEGVGLGLPIVKKLLELNEAVISIKSKKGIGTTVSVNFGKSYCDKKPENSRSLKNSFPLKEISGIKTILIVEDDLMNQTTIKRFINDSYKTIFTDSSELALGILADNKIDLILMDISIRGKMNGLELTKLLKSSKEFSHIPIIIITAHAFEKDRQNSLSAGCDNYLPKPFTKESLLKMISCFQI